jgi:putative exosortase-associated protein (TIGR04073 family)
MYTRILGGLCIAGILLWYAPAWCGGEGDSERSVRPFERFGRGLANTITSPLEIPAQIYNRAAYQEEHNSNPFAVIGGFFEGIPMGVVYFGWRLGAGCFDVLTFPFRRFDECLIDPEYVTFSHESLVDD